MTTHPTSEAGADWLPYVLSVAEMPPLLAALSVATGNDAMIAPELRPRVTPDDLLDPPQGGMSVVGLSTGRQLALEALQSRHLNVDESQIPQDRLRRAAAYIVGDEHVDEYMPMLAYEFGLTVESRREAEQLTTKEAESDFHVAIIGAGMSGIAAAAELQRAGVRFTIVERASDVGGVWHENNYPGCRLDTNNFAYSYSWAQKSDWNERYSSRESVVEYFKNVADSIDLRAKTMFDTSLQRAEWIEEDKLWRLEVKTSSAQVKTIEANVVISAVGQLNQPSIPAIDGQEGFRGDAVHTATWPDGLDLHGKRVAVVGSGASAFQVVPEIAKIVGSLDVYQRSAPWMLPTPGYRDEVPAGMAYLFSTVPNYHRWFRFYQYWLTQNRRRYAQVDSSWPRSDSVSERNFRLREVLVGHIEKQFDERQDLLPAVVPTYPPYGKRMLRDDGSWATALKQSHTRLITEPIVEITENGIRTGSGVREVDVIVYATGFRATEFLSGIEVIGQDGRRLNEEWKQNPRAYLGISIPGFPNFFSLYGPNTNLVVNGSLIAMTEAGVAHIMKCLNHLFETGSGAIRCRKEALDEFCNEVDSVNSEMAWGIDGVTNWYKNADGRVTQNWPFTVDDYFERATSGPLDAYAVDSASRVSNAS